MVAIRITVKGNFRNQESVNSAALDEEYAKLETAIDAEVTNTLGATLDNISRADPVIAGTSYTENITVTLPDDLTEDMIDRMVTNLYHSHPYIGSGHAGLRPGEGNDALADCAFPEISAEIAQAGGRRRGKKTRHAKRKQRATRRRKNHRRK